MNTIGVTMPQRGPRDAYIAAVAAILAAFVGAGATFYATDKQIKAEQQHNAELRNKLETYRAKYESAPKQFTEKLGELVAAAPQYQNTPGTDTRLLNRDPNYRHNIEVSARGIVAARNDLRSDLDAIGNRLDSQIDELQAELAKPEPDPERLVTTMEVLRQKWPSKEAEIEVAVRKLLAELGLVANLGE